MGKFIQVATSQSNNLDEAISNLLRNIDKPEFIISFFSPNFSAEEIYAKLRKEVGDKVNIIGCSTAGEYTDIRGDCIKGTVAFMAISSPYLNVGVGVSRETEKDPFTAGKEGVIEAFRRLDKKKASTIANLYQTAFLRRDTYEVGSIRIFTILTLMSGINGYEEEVLRGIVDGIGAHLPIVGGSAGDDLQFKETYVIGNGVYKNSSVITVIQSALKIGIGMGHPYYPTGKTCVVTKAKGRIVYELDGKPAVERVKEILETEDLNPDIFAQKPFGTKSTDVSGQYIIKSMAYANEDGSITFYAEVPENITLTLMESDPDYAYESFKKTLETAIKDAGNPKKIGAIVIFNCVLRYLLKLRFQNIDDTKIVKELLGEDIPIIGFNTYGEQGKSIGGGVGNYNQTATLLVIGDEAL